MKRCISILAVLLISCFATLYGKKIKYIISEKPTNKTVSFSIFTTGYSTPVYKKTKAKVTLTVCRFYDGKQEIVWQGVVNKGSVKNYPVRDNSLYKEVCIYNVYDKKETLAAYYEVEYVSKGSKISYVKGIPLSRGSTVDSLNISI